jgi:hypothetical protein
VRAAPAVSCAKMHIAKAHTSIQVQRKQSGLPCAMVLRLISCSPRRPDFVDTVVLKKLASRELDTSPGASGPHDFTVRLTRRSSKAHPRPPLPAPTSVTMANAPLSGRDGDRSEGDLPLRSSLTAATHWHDGQISLRAVKIYLMARCIHLPFSPCGRRWREAPDEGSKITRGCDPSPVRIFDAIHPLPQGRRMGGAKRYPSVALRR